MKEIHSEWLGTHATSKAIIVFRADLPLGCRLLEFVESILDIACRMLPGLLHLAIWYTPEVSIRLMALSVNGCCSCTRVGDKVVFLTAKANQSGALSAFLPLITPLLQPRVLFIISSQLSTIINLRIARSYISAAASLFKSTSHSASASRCVYFLTRLAASSHSASFCLPIETRRADHDNTISF